MNNIPIIPGLVQDNSVVIYEQMTGSERYRMSMVSKEWNVYCNRWISEPPRLRKQFETLVKNIDILSIIRHLDYINMFNVMEIGCRYGNIELVNIFIAKNMHNCSGNTIKRRMVDNTNDWNSGLYGACIGGSVAMIQLMIEKGARNWDLGLHGACINGSIKLVKLMIEKGAWDWNRGLHGACRNGSIELVQLMIEKGATDWNRGLHGACLSGNMNLTQIMIEKGATDWNGGLYGACDSNNIDIIRLMVVNGATFCNMCCKPMKAHIKN